MRRAIEQRCDAAIDGRCHVGRLELARDGALATGVRVQSHVRGLSATVDAISVDWSWWSLILGRPQAIDVRIAGVVVTDDASAIEVLDEVRRLRGRRSEGARAHRSQLQHVVVEQMNARGALGPTLSGRLDELGVDWTRGGPLVVSWHNAALQAGPIDEVATGRCSLRREREPEVHTTIDCDGPHARIDLDDTASPVDAAVAFARSLREALRAEVTTEGQSGEGAATAPARDPGSTEACLVAGAGAAGVDRNAGANGPLTNGSNASATGRAANDPRAGFTGPGMRGQGAMATGNAARRTDDLATADAARARALAATGTPANEPVGSATGTPANEPGAGATVSAAAAARARDGLGAITWSARDADLTLVRGSQLIVGLRPGTLRVVVQQGALREAHVRFGGADGPAIQTDLVLQDGDARAWHADIAGDALPLQEIVRWVPSVPWHATDHGLAHVRFHAEPVDGVPGIVVLDGEASLRDFGLLQHGLAREAIDGLSASVRGATRIDVARRRVETEGVQVELNGIVVALAGWAEHRGDRTALDVALRLPATDCDAIRTSVPDVVAGPVRDLGFTGRIAADVHLALATDSLASTQLDLDVDNQCRVVRDAMTRGIRRLGGPFVQRVQEPTGLRAFVTGPGSAAWVPMERISPYVANSVVSHEDGRFYRHHGFDPPEIRQAIVRDVGARRFVYGASTLSMQLAKNVFLEREKTLVRKLQEVVLTWYLEQSLDKHAILELYLNVVEFGPGIYGIGPASRFYFDREPRDLTPLQAIYLATMLPGPVARFAATYARGAVGPEGLARLRAYARVMQLRGYLTAEETAAAQIDPLLFRQANAIAHGAMTQDVDPATTDAMAAEMAPPPARDDEVPSEAVANGETIVDEDRAPVAPPAAPISLRTGGTL